MMRKASVKQVSSYFNKHRSEESIMSLLNNRTFKIFMSPLSNWGMFMSIPQRIILEIPDTFSQ